MFYVQPSSNRHCETEVKKKDNKMAKQGSTKVDAQQLSHVEKIPSTISPDAEIAAEHNLATNQRIRHTPTPSQGPTFTCLPSELEEAEILENLEWRTEQFEQEMMNKIACFKMKRANMQALIIESNQWRDKIDVLTRICAHSIVGRGEKPTTDGESSPALPVEAVYAVEPSNNHYSILLDEDGPQVGETIDVQPEKQLKEPREKPVSVEQTITIIGDEPREGTDADKTIEDSPQVGEKIE